ncbi:hypothetical protein Ndes2526B_g05516 [Nannochloris sp. 'desiccata']
MQAALASRAALVRTTTTKASRRSVGVVAAASPGSWFPGNPEATAPHLSGVDLPANFGFDPLNLAKSPEALKCIEILKREE